MGSVISSSPYYKSPADKLFSAVAACDLGHSALEQLAERISSSSKTVAEYLRENGHPQPSFERDAPQSTLPSCAPAEVAIARRELMEASLRMYQLATGNNELLASIFGVSYQVQAAMRWLIHFNIFHLVPLQGSSSYANISRLANVPESYLKRVARLVMTQNILHEPVPDNIAHTAASALLVSGPGLHDWATVMAEMSVPTANHLVEATERWGESVAKNETAYNVAFNTNLPFFSYLAQPEMAQCNKLFAGYMQCVAKSEGTDIKHLLNGFDWGSLPKGTRVIDVGGSTGHASIALAKAYSHLTFTVQDTPNVIKNAPDTLLKLNLHTCITNRIAFQPHDFFEPQPIDEAPPPATVYLLRMIIHDWPDAEANQVLSHLVPCLERDPVNSRIIIMDTVLPKPGSTSPVIEAVMRVRDLIMLQVFNSKEREVADWIELVHGVDERLKIMASVQPIGSVMTVMELSLNH